MSNPEKGSEVLITKPCFKCRGTGKVWWYQLDDNAGHDPGDCIVDDTLYECDECSGKGEVTTFR